MTKRKPDKEVVCLGSAVGDEDDADDEDDEGVSLVMMRLVMKLLMMMPLLVTMMIVMLRRLLADGAVDEDLADTPPSRLLPFSMP